jgi:hypothetical protein
MRIFPAEHQFSWEKVMLFCVGAIISLIAAWFFNSKQHLTPSLRGDLDIFENNQLIASAKGTAGLERRTPRQATE